MLIDVKTTSSYEEYISSNTISDSTANIAIKRTEEKEELKAKICELGIYIAEADYKLNQIKETMKVLSYKERIILEAKVIYKLQSHEIGSITYLNYFNQTRSEDAINNIIRKAYNAMKNVKTTFCIQIAY